MGVSVRANNLEIPLFSLFKANYNLINLRQCKIGSFAGAATSKKVTEVYKGKLSTMVFCT